MDFGNIKREREDEMPKPSRSLVDYTPLINEAKKLKRGEVLRVPIEKDHQITAIQGALSRLEKTRKYRVIRRTFDGQKTAVVKLAAGYN